MNIDVHAHFIPPSILGKGYDDILSLEKMNDCWHLRINATTTTPLTAGMLDPAIQVCEMDACDIHQRFLCITPFHFAYDRMNVRQFARDYNDALEKDTRAFSDRFRLLATLPFPDVNTAIDELERIMSMRAFVGVEIASNLNGMELGDQALDPFWQRAEELGAFVLIHPHYCIEDKRLHTKYLSNYIGNPLETTMAAFHLIADEVLERHPNLTICLCHGGGYLSLAMARIDHGYRVRSELKNLKYPPSHYARKFFVDTVEHDKSCLQFVVERFGVSHVLMGTDYPFDMGDLNPVSSVNELALCKNDKEKICGKNVEQLIK